MHCTACGASVSAGDMFCGGCGARVEPAAAAAPASPPPQPAAARPGEPAVDPAEAARVLAASLRQSTENYLSDGSESVPKGCLVLIISFFSMPFKTLNLAGKLLREVSRQGALETDSDTPT